MFSFPRPLILPSFCSQDLLSVAEVPQDQYAVEFKCNSIQHVGVHPNPWTVDTLVRIPNQLAWHLGNLTRATLVPFYHLSFGP